MEACDYGFVVYTWSILRSNFGKNRVLLKISGTVYFHCLMSLKINAELLMKKAVKVDEKGSSSKNHNNSSLTEFQNYVTNTGFQSSSITSNEVLIIILLKI